MLIGLSSDLYNSSPEKQDKMLFILKQIEVNALEVPNHINADIFFKLKILSEKGKNKPHIIVLIPIPCHFPFGKLKLALYIHESVSVLL